MADSAVRPVVRSSASIWASGVMAASRDSPGGSVKGAAKPRAIRSHVSMMARVSSNGLAGGDFALPYFATAWRARSASAYAAHFQKRACNSRPSTCLAASSPPGGSPCSAGSVGLGRIRLASSAICFRNLPMLTPSAPYTISPTERSSGRNPSPRIKSPNPKIRAIKKYIFPSPSASAAAWRSFILGPQP